MPFFVKRDWNRYYTPVIILVLVLTCWRADDAEYPSSDHFQNYKYLIQQLYTHRERHWRKRYIRINDKTGKGRVPRASDLPGTTVNKHCVFINKRQRSFFWTFFPSPWTSSFDLFQECSTCSVVKTQYSLSYPRPSNHGNSSRLRAENSPPQLSSLA